MGTPMSASRCVVPDVALARLFSTGMRSYQYALGESTPVHTGSPVNNVGCIAAVMWKCDAEVSTTGHYALPFILSPGQRPADKPSPFGIFPILQHDDGDHNGFAMLRKTLTTAESP